MDSSQLFPFLAASLLLTLAPGPDILYVLSQGVLQGQRSAMLTALGLCSGISVHTLGAALGVSVLFHQSALAFAALKWAGVVYLFYLALRALRGRKPSLTGKAIPPERGWVLFRRGFLMNILNPKVSLFFLAFLPQFVTVQAGPVSVQMLWLGFLFLVQALVVFFFAAWASAKLGQRLSTYLQGGRFLNRMTAGVFLFLGLRLALVRS